MGRFRYRLLLALVLWVAAPALVLVHPMAAALGLAAAAVAAVALAWYEVRLFCPRVSLERNLATGPATAYPITARGLWGVDLEAPGPRIRLVDGVPHVDYPGIGVRANPAYVAWWALQAVPPCLASRTPDLLERIRRPAAWLRAHARPRCGGGVAWEYDFDWPNGTAVLRAPWISAMAQGLAISALIRAADLLGQPGYLDLALTAVEPFRHDLDAGGVRTTLGNGAPYYEEYPIRPETLVLDGSLFALVGLAELAQATGNAGVEELFRTGAAGISARLALWDYRGFWSRYGRRGALASADYHRLNALLLQVVGDRAGEARMLECGRTWERSATSPACRFAATVANRWVQLWEGAARW